MPVNVTPNGAGFGVKPAGNAGGASFGTVANGTITDGYPARAAMPLPFCAGNSRASSRCDVQRWLRKSSTRSVSSAAAAHTTAVPVRATSQIKHLNRTGDMFC